MQSRRHLRRLAVRGGGLESQGDAADLSRGRRRESLERLDFRLSALVAGATDPTAAEAAAAVRSEAEAALDRLAADGAEAALTPAMQVALEAVVEADGSRPVAFLRQGRIDLEDPSLGSWAADAANFRLEIACLSQSVGRVDLPGTLDGFVGTAFVVREGVVATNRHVLEAIARRAPRSAGGGWELRPGVRVDFGREHEEPEDPVRQFDVAGVAFAGPERIGLTLDLAKLDLALLELAPKRDAEFPRPLAMSADRSGPRRDSRLYVIGYPGRPEPGAEIDEVLRRLYASTFGVKRWAPGEVDRALGEVEGDATPARSFAHDASTLIGSSGSCVVDLVDGEAVVGLHFGGWSRFENYAHAVSQVLEGL